MADTVIESRIVMVFESQLQRQMIVNCLVGWIPDIIIAAILTSYFKGGLIGFGFIILGLQVLSVVTWILDNMVQWAIFTAFSKRFIQRQFYEYLVINKYPAPNEYESSTHEYLMSVMENKDLDPEVRIKAAIDVGTFAAYSGAFEKQRVMKLSIAAERAIKQYRVWLSRVGLYGSNPREDVV